MRTSPLSQGYRAQRARVRRRRRSALILAPYLLAVSAGSAVRLSDSPHGLWHTVALAGVYAAAFLFLFTLSVILRAQLRLRALERAQLKFSATQAALAAAHAQSALAPEGDEPQSPAEAEPELAQAPVITRPAARPESDAPDPFSRVLGSARGLHESDS